MHDAVTFELAGTPSLVVVTEVFERLALQTARQLGLDRYRPLLVPHPIFNRDDDWIREQVERLVRPAMFALTGSDEAEAPWRA